MIDRQHPVVGGVGAFGGGGRLRRETPDGLTGHRVAVRGVELEIEVVAGEVEIEGRELYLIVKELGDRIVNHLVADSNPVQILLRGSEARHPCPPGKVDIFVSCVVSQFGSFF
jgi:hypothetical protein